MGIPLDQAHIDLRYPLAALGYKGGLKKIERQVGLETRRAAGAVRRLVRHSVYGVSPARYSGRLEPYCDIISKMLSIYDAVSRSLQCAHPAIAFAFGAYASPACAGVLLDLMRLLSIGHSQTRGAHEIFLKIPSSTSLRYSDDAIQLSFQCGRLLNFSRQVIKSKSHQVKNGKRLLPLT